MTVIMNSEIRFLALVTALLMLWAASSMVRESAAPAPMQAITATTLSQPSDARLKQEVQELAYGLPDLLALRPVSYRYKAFPSQAHIGFIAQEVEPIIPEVVSLSPADPESIAPQYYSVSYGELVPLLVRSIQEQQKTINTLESRLAALEAPSTR